MAHTVVSATVPTPRTHGIRYLARQPILDAHENVFGYELLFRGGPETLFCAINSDRASLSTMDYSITLGAGSLTNGKRAFINCTRELLVGGLVTLLPSDLTILEILEDVEPDPEVLAACRRLRSLGYLLALDDFTGDAMGSPFFELVSFVKLDLRATDPSQIRPIAKKLSHRGFQLVAEKVETREEFDVCLHAGFQYFQGYFFCRPTILTRRDISPAQQSQLKLLRMANDPKLDLKGLENIVRSDVSLCYRLLRYLNSAAFGVYPVRSIMHALTLLGEREVRKWIAFVTAALLAGDSTPELVRMAMVRGKFCECLAPPNRSDDYFLAGLFSLLDTMLERPMEQLAAELPVSDECRAALVGGDNEIANLLRQCSACEKADFDTETATQGSETIWDAFHRASVWTDSLVGTVF
jgi:EAL and modified HD-GYP domain-containing signal transduction protein